MMGNCRFQGVPNQPESASRSASAAVSADSSMIAAQAMWASRRIRRAWAGRISISTGVDVDAMPPVPRGLAEVGPDGHGRRMGRAL